MVTWQNNLRLVVWKQFGEGGGGVAHGFLYQSLRIHCFLILSIIKTMNVRLDFWSLWAVHCIRKQKCVGNCIFINM